MQAFGPEPATIDPVDRSTAHPDYATVLYADVHGATIGAEDACRLYPLVRLLQDALVDPLGPMPVIGSSRSPDVGDAVARLSNG